MIKHILTVGDSFTYGEELANLDQAWPVLLSKQLSANLVNLARPGSGNKRMIRHVIDHVASGQPIDLVVVGWSSPGRMEFADEDGFFDIWPGYSGNMFKREQPWRVELLEYINRHHNEEWLYRQFLSDVVLLQSFLKDHNIQYVMCKTVGNEYYHTEFFTKMIPVARLIDTDNFLGWPNAGMSEWTFNTPQGPNGHFLEAGHQLVANQVYEHIRNLGWLS
jgi:hypothetical protein